jgi:hypothetical protein
VGGEEGKVQGVTEEERAKALKEEKLTKQVDAAVKSLQALSEGVDLGTRAQTSLDNIPIASPLDRKEGGVSGGLADARPSAPLEGDVLDKLVQPGAMEVGDNGKLVGAEMEGPAPEMQLFKVR